MVIKLEKKIIRTTKSFSSVSENFHFITNEVEEQMKEAEEKNSKTCMHTF